MGLDAGLGVLHTDTAARGSLGCDVMEPVRPQIDSYVLDLITREYPSLQGLPCRERDCRRLSGDKRPLVTDGTPLIIRNG
jgi:CRISPR/Cas system-associated endonuclease Cas1